MTDPSLLAAYHAKSPDYRPRTRHLQADGNPRHINRLIHDDSPYLLQHAHNPVDWYPWGEEAFAKARAEDKPVFLSIGYATCHWCHVMEHESFEDPDIAGLLNRHFIAIKVDRETRPDVDETYMSALLLINGHGGWPMSSFLTPQGKPFFAGTYYPPARFGGLLERIHELWQSRQADLIEQADRLSQAVAAEHGQATTKGQLAEDSIARALNDCLRMYDRQHGGFSQAPKFPHEPLLLLLLDQLRRHPRTDVLEALMHSLDVMARGGVYDQVGGGFHRYATDDHWLVPHFEKMLYNQAQLARVYLQAWQLTGQAPFRRTGEDILDYVLREMTDPQGRFYSATDADSEGTEGRFFVWTPAEIDALLPTDDAVWIKRVFGISQEGNFEGRSIPLLAHSLEALAELEQQPLESLLERFERCRRQLRTAREQRPKPLCDDKIIVAWNSLMILALTEASRLTGQAGYGAAAKRAAEALWQGNRRTDGALLRIARGAQTSVPASLEDYAYFAAACLQLHDLYVDPVWLERAQDLTEQTLQRFGDGDGGLFLSEAGIDPTQMARLRDAGHDGAMPSSTGVLSQVLAQLAQRTDEQTYLQQAEALIASFAQRLTATPSLYPSLLVGAETLRLGRCDGIAHAAGGKIRLVARRSAPHQIDLQFEIAAGVHLNAGNTLRVQLDAKGWRLADCRWPEPLLQPVAFQPEPLATYSGQIQVTLTLQTLSDTPLTRLVPIQVQLQACSNRACLPQEQVSLLA